MKSKAYNIFIAILALASIILVVMDFKGLISLSSAPYLQIDLLILLIFWVDYIYRLVKSENKGVFIKSNILDLLAIIPFNSIFTFFRIFRVLRLFRLVKATKFLRILGMSKRVNGRVESFLKTNGLIYVLYLAGITILTAAFLISHFEKLSFPDSLWWSIVTCTTVGYGDIYPTTIEGRLVAVVLMILGVALLGMITGTITTYFSKSSQSSIDEELKEKISTLPSEKKKELLSILPLIENDDLFIEVKNKKSNKKGAS